MDQIKIGKFIAETRKAQNMTQKQLAEALSISDKTISKWECGKGLPEVSLMLPLCDTLHITVNDLPSGANVSQLNHQEKAEENMMNLMKENEENKRRMVLSVLCGVITIIAVCSLIVIAAFLEMPTVAQIALIAFTAATAAAGVGATAILDAKAGYFECPHCHSLFVPTMGEYVKGYHTITKRKLTCPEGGKSGMCKHRIIR